jgi:hypothetical protein
MFNQHLYVVSPEDDMTNVDLQYFFDKKSAMRRMVHFIVSTKKKSKMNVYCPDKENKDSPLRLYKEITMKKSSNGHYSFWLLKAFLDYSKDDVIDNANMFFDTFEETIF